MLTKIRLRTVWVLVPLYLLLARPTALFIAIGLLFAVAGGMTRAWAAGAIRKNKVLSTHGPYAFTRNPLYLGSFLIGLGFAIAAGPDRWWIFTAIFIAFFVLVYFRVMRKEEDRLERLFGQEFRSYAAAVPRFLPRIPPWSDVTGRTSPARPEAVEAVETTPQGAFQLKRYIANREYQAILGMGIMFLLLVAKMLF